MITRGGGPNKLACSPEERAEGRGEARKDSKRGERGEEMKTKGRDTEKEKRGRTEGGKMHKDRERGNGRQNGEVARRRLQTRRARFTSPVPLQHIT